MALQPAKSDSLLIRIFRAHGVLSTESIKSPNEVRNLPTLHCGVADVASVLCFRVSETLDISQIHMILTCPQIKSANL